MDELIGRQSAIDAINHICPIDTEYDCTLLDRVDVRRVLSELPSKEITQEDVEAYCRARCLVVMTTELFECLKRGLPSAQPEPLVKESRTLVNDLVKDTISRQAAIDRINKQREHLQPDIYPQALEKEADYWHEKCQSYEQTIVKLSNALAERREDLPSAQPEEVIPHRNYKYLSDYWCECGWHLGKKGAVKYCSECGRKVNWDG